MPKGGSGRAVAQKAPIPITSGSAKQNEWATNIRDSALSRLGYYLEAFKHTSGPVYLSGEISQQDRNSMIAGIREAMSRLSATTDARLIIDARDSFGRTAEGDVKSAAKSVRRIVAAFKLHNR